MNPIVIDPPDFDQKAAWRECNEYVEKCGGLAYPDGEPNMWAAAGADPGVCSCPACGEFYWAWGRRQKCRKCNFEYPTDWWCMYSWGTSAAKRTQRYKHDEYMKHPYYQHGFEHPVENAWKTCHTEAWRAEIREKFAPTKGPPHAH